MATLELDVTVVDEVDPPSAVDSDEFLHLTRFVLEGEGRAGTWAVSIVLTDDARLRQLHRRFMGIDSETDVMTFPFADDAAADGEQGGDVVISVERATAQAADYGHDVADEVRFLLVHGLLHLCGWDDGTDPARLAMWQRQATLIDTFKGHADERDSSPRSE